jgi:purine-nucleoside phosphorylase
VECFMQPSSSSPLRERLDEASKLVRVYDQRVPDVVLVLGSGLGPYASTLVNTTEIPYAEIPHMPTVSISGHAGKLIMGELPDCLPNTRSPIIAALSGRSHLYEGYTAQEVVFPIRLLLSLGARLVVLTNAAGAIAPTLRPGDLVLITDHLNLQGQSPLSGPNDPDLGPRFPDMTDVYDRELRSLAHVSAENAGFHLREGVYAALMGPAYETPAEIRMLRTLGADVVGMSTVPEALAARHMGARVLGLSCVTNLAAGLSPTRLSHAEVEATAQKTRSAFTQVVDGTLRALAAVSMSTSGVCL